MSYGRVTIHDIHVVSDIYVVTIVSKGALDNLIGCIIQMVLCVNVRSSCYSIAIFCV